MIETLITVALDLKRRRVDPEVTGRFAYWSFRLPPVPLRLDSIRLRTVCQFTNLMRGVGVSRFDSCLVRRTGGRRNDSWAFQSIRITVVSPTPCSPTSWVDSPTFSMSVRLRLKQLLYKAQKPCNSKLKILLHNLFIRVRSELNQKAAIFT